VRLGAHVEAGRLRLSLHAAEPPRTRSELWSEDDRTEVTPIGAMRTNRVMRKVVDVATGAVLEEGVIAENRRRLLRPEERRRTCLTCGEDQCHARVELPRVEVGT
jgi:vancomycin resistance protein VanW